MEGTFLLLPSGDITDGQNHNVNDDDSLHGNGSRRLSLPNISYHHHHPLNPRLTGRAALLVQQRRNLCQWPHSLFPPLLPDSSFPLYPPTKEGKRREGAHFRLMTLSAKPDKTPLFGVGYRGYGGQGCGRSTKVISGYVHLERKERRQQEHQQTLTHDIPRPPTYFIILGFIAINFT